MKHGLAALICATAIGSFPVAALAQAAGNGGDKRGEVEQAQTHPNEANQVPYALATGVALGEVYYEPGYGYGYRAHRWANRPCAVEPSLCAP